MFGEKAVELIKCLNRDSSDPMPPYNSLLVQNVIQEMDQCNQQIQLFVSSNDGTNDITQEDYRSKLVVTQIQFSALLWNKRCLLAYHYNRIQRLKRLRWEFGTVLPNDIRSNLSESELIWFLDYSKNLSEYMNKLNDGKGIDLSLYKKPPKRLFIKVRCNTEYGDFELDDGTTVILSKDSMDYYGKGLNYLRLISLPAIITV